MKKVLLLLVAAALMLVPATALGAIHHWTGDNSPSPILAGLTYSGILYSDPLVKFDTWYTISGKAKSIEFAGIQGESFTILGAEYYQNDQTFLGYLKNDGSSILSGSYLFKNNVFVGMMYMSGNSDATEISAGYRWDWGQEGYVALSWDYFSTPINSETLGYELNGIYYAESYKFFGQIYYVDLLDEVVYNVGFNYQTSDTFVFGLSINKVFILFGPGEYYTAGFSWTPDFMVLDVKVYSFEDDDATVSMINAVFSATDALDLGLESVSSSDDDDVYYYLKAKYALKNGAALKGSYLLGNDDHDSALFLGYQKDLK
jgi:hypothetical protein